MNLVSRLLPPNHVLLDLDVSSKKRLFEQIGLLFENTRQIPRARVFDSLFDREKLGSTGLGYGVAIPHGRIKTLKEPVCAFRGSHWPSLHCSRGFEHGRSSASQMPWGSVRTAGVPRAFEDPHCRGSECRAIT